MRADRIRAAIQAHDAALAGDERAAGGRPERGEADAFHACHRDQHRVRVVGQGDVEFRAHRLLGQFDAAVHGGGFARHFFDTDLGDAAKQGRRQRAALGLDHAAVGGHGKASADGANHATLHQDIGIAQRALAGGGMHGGAANQHLLRNCRQCQRSQHQCGQRTQARAAEHGAAHRATSWPSMKSETGCNLRSWRSYTCAPSIYTCSASA